MMENMHIDIYYIVYIKYTFTFPNERALPAPKVIYSNECIVTV